MSDDLALLTTEEMAAADRLAAEAGVPSLTLMENAGRAVADEAAKMAKPGARIAVLCGPGNNGGDGFVAARLLKGRGFDVGVALLGPRAALKGDAGEMAKRWDGEVHPLASDAIDGAALVIDAIFGAGLSRRIEEPVKSAIAAANKSGLPALAVDVPSGLDGTTGKAVGGIAIEARKTVTFFRRKPGHLLLPGRSLCGDVAVADIGIPPKVLDRIEPTVHANWPELWRHTYPWPHADGHKYTRGHALVVSGPPESTGAARLGARGALRVGAGLVTVASPRAAFPVNAAQLTAIMVRPFEGADGLRRILEDKRKNAVLIGPGLGTDAWARDQVLAVLDGTAAVVLDAEALTNFAHLPEQLFRAIHAHPERPVVLTPHAGEHRRLFGERPMRESKLDHARHAAEVSGAVVVLKGADTVIAEPSGGAAINENAPATLATAGSGDVLAGFITGLLAQGMPAFEAACAGVWLHGAAAVMFGPGLIAEDLPEVLPRVLAKLHERIGQSD